MIFVYSLLSTKLTQLTSASTSRPPVEGVEDKEPQTAPEAKPTEPQSGNRLTLRWGWQVVF